jgi:hypothetical protein
MTGQQNPPDPAVAVARGIWLAIWWAVRWCLRFVLSLIAAAVGFVAVQRMIDTGTADGFLFGMWLGFVAILWLAGWGFREQKRLSQERKQEESAE